MFMALSLFNYLIIKNKIYFLNVILSYVKIYHLMASALDLILVDDVEHLGKAGELVKVKLGYARNFLLPRGLAHGLS